MSPVSSQTCRRSLRLSCRPALALVALASCAAPEPPPEAESPEPVGEAVLAETVAQAAASSCTTLSVKPLSDQIVAQSNCIAPGAFSLIPAQPNLVIGAVGYPYLQEPARDAFVAALASAPGITMHANSLLRTVAQQYLLYQWYLDGLCGVALAAKPGNSNHETGLAVDVQEHASWQAALAAHDFAWFGSGDPVHFDYAGPDAVDHGGLDVLAFQELWNDNHPNDPIDEDGLYGPQTEARLSQTPATGFPIGASCQAPAAVPDVHPSIVLVGGEDRFSDGASAGVPDLFEGDAHSLRVELENVGSASAANVELAFLVDEPHLAANDYLVESDWGHPGTFEPNDANDSPANPAHGELLGPTFTLQMNALSPGETKRVTLTVVAGLYSVDLAGSRGIRAWVKDVAGYYHQDDYGGAVTNLDGSQTYGGGRLEVAQPSDVYSRTRWEWDTDRLEGWTALGSAVLSTNATEKLVLLAGDAGALGPATSFPAAGDAAVALRARRSGGDGAARLYFATFDAPAMSDDKSVLVELPDDGTFHDLEIPLGDHPLWAGTITGLRFDPFGNGAGSAEVDYLRVVSGEFPIGQGGSGGAQAAAGAGGGGAAGGGADAAAGAAGLGDDVPSGSSEADGAGCACRTGAGGGRDSAAARLVLALGAVAAARRLSRADGRAKRRARRR